MEPWGGGLTREPIGERGCGRVRGREPPPLGLILEDFLFVELASGTWPDMGHRAVRAQAARPGEARRGVKEGGAGRSAGRGPAAAAYPRRARAGCCTGAARQPARRPTGPRSRPWRAAGGRGLGVARAWRYGPSYDCLRARQGQRERLGSGYARVTPASRSRPTAVPAGRARCAGRSQDAGSPRRRAVGPWERAGRGWRAHTSQADGIG